MPEKFKRTNVFISYSHEDSKWLERLRVHLRPLERVYNNMDFWDDTQISAGANWKGKIDNALASFKIAVLLISADFIASDFIHSNELPSILNAAEREDAVILPVIVAPSRFTRSNLSQFQAINDPNRSLEQLSPVKREIVFDQVAQKIEEILDTISQPITKIDDKSSGDLLGKPSSFAIDGDGNIVIQNIKSSTITINSQKGSDIQFLAKFGRDGSGKIKRIGKSYPIHLFIRNFPTDTEQVVYKLHETYIHPIREVHNSQNDFEIYLTSYGDYIIKVEIFGNQRVTKVEDWLTAALRKFYGDEADEDVINAIKYLEVH